MKPLGIVLLFVNLLAAAGVVYLATQSWAKRHEQNTAILKEELVASGLPLESPAGAKPVDLSKPEEGYTLKFPIPGRPATEVRAKVLIDHFAGAKREGKVFASMAGNPPLSVVGELDEVKKQIDADVAGYNADPAGGLAYLVGTAGADYKLTPGLLSLLADDFEERVIYREWLDEARNPQPLYPPAALWQLAKDALDAKLSLPLTKPNEGTATEYANARQTARVARDKALDEWQKATGDPKLLDQVPARKREYDEARMAYWKAMVAKSAPLSEGDQRRKAAGVLVVVDPSAGGQKRTALTVGLPDYTAAIIDRVERLSSMPERFDRQGETDVANFVVLYEQKLATSRDLDRMLQKQVEITKAFAGQKKGAEDQVATRTAHRNGAQGRVNDLAAKVKAASEAQQALEKNVFELQQEVGLGFARLFDLEDQVYQAEKKKAGK